MHGISASAWQEAFFEDHAYAFDVLGGVPTGKIRCDNLKADPRLCAAIVDRLAFGGTILETGTDSYRLAQATKQRNTDRRARKAVSPQTNITGTDDAQVVSGLTYKRCRTKPPEPALKLPTMTLGTAVRPAGRPELMSPGLMRARSGQPGFGLVELT